MANATVPVLALSKFHAAAIALAKRGVPVFPCRPASKCPACTHGFKDATTDLAQVNRWWREDRFRNVAFATGAVSNIDVLDIDEDGGEAALASLEKQHSVMPPSVEVISGGGGRHVYLRHITGARCYIRKLWAGTDYKADGGYSMAPPSIHPDSHRPYSYSVDSANAIAQAPDWLVGLVKKHIAANGHANGGKSPEEWQAMFANGVGEGKRNSTIASLTGHLLRRSVDLRVSYELARAFNAYRCTPPLMDDEVVSIVESIGKLELKRRTGGAGGSGGDVG